MAYENIEELRDDIEEINDYFFYQVTYSLAQYISISALIDINEARHRDEEGNHLLTIDRMVETMVADASIMFSLLQLTFTIPEYMEKYLHSIGSLNVPADFIHLVSVYGGTLSEGMPEDGSRVRESILLNFDRFLIVAPLLISVTDEKICSQSNTLTNEVYDRLKETSQAALEREGVVPSPIKALIDTYNRIFPLSEDDDEEEIEIHHKIERVFSALEENEIIIE